MDKKKRIIGISGKAGSGKDTLFKLLESKLPNTKRFALADLLKLEIREYLLDKYSIDVLDCDRQQKEIIRPELVSYGAAKRGASMGTYWTYKLTNQIAEYFLSSDLGQTAIITDIRYDFYPKDEVYWLKNEMGGILVHLNKYFICPNSKKRTNLPYVNEHEEENDPKILSKANYKINWPDAKDKDGNADLNYLDIYAEEFVKYILR